MSELSKTSNKIIAHMLLLLEMNKKSNSLGSKTKDDMIKNWRGKLAVQLVLYFIIDACVVDIIKITYI